MQVLSVRFPSIASYKLIELDLSGYVKAMANKGADDLFPEFRPNSEAETFGNV